MNHVGAIQRFFIPIFSLLALVACKPSHLTPEELSAYIADEDHGLKKTVAIGKTNISVTYRPTDLWVQQELGNGAADPKKVEELRNKYDRYFYFILSLSHNEKEALHQAGGEQYSELVQTLSFRMNDFVTLTTAQDTIPVGDFILNRTYGMSNSTDLLFVFSREKAKDTDWVQFNLNEFGLGAGNQRFRFKINAIADAPGIEFK
jgi:hypothetical protein